MAMSVQTTLQRETLPRILPYPVYDADGHLYETKDAFLRYMPPKYRKEFQYVLVNGRTKLAIGGQISEYIPNPTFDVVAYPGSHELWYRGHNTEGLSLRELTGDPLLIQPAFQNGADRLKLLDEQGIYAQLIYPTLASAIEGRMNYDHDLMAAALHSLNQWTLEEWGFNREGRIFAAPMITLADVNLACQELEWALANGAPMVSIRPAPVPGYRGSRSLGSPEFDPFWARVNEAGIFVVLHVSDSGYDEIYRWWTGGGSGEMLAFDRTDPLKMMIDSPGRAIHDTLSSLIGHGVFDRHPNIRIVSAENGSTWLPHLIHMMNRAYGQLPKGFKRHPVEALREHVYIAPFYEENLTLLKELIGIDRMLFNSDYPHPEGLRRPLDFLDEMHGFSDAEIQKVVSTNLKGLLEGAR
jgi:predicted TIM-barrel fold metal-dependent hydrolase